MADFIESARGILSQSQSRMEATANNVANMTTPGFKTQHLYSTVSAETDLHASETLLKQRLDLEQGRLTKTNNPLDLAVSGAGMFRLRGADGSVAFTRSGHFQLAENGRVVTAQGFALQTADGGDLVVPNAKVRITADGTVMDGERPIARLALYQPVAGADVRPLGGSMFAVPDGLTEEVAQPELRQGMVEASNVSLADEMVSMMDALRQAEGGARLVQTYDDLMGKVIQTLGGK
jgi:flagellar basal-body rod protein FlgF